MDKVKITVDKTYIRRSKMLNVDSACVECGNLFKVSIDEVGRYKDKKIPLPTRCKACRRYKIIEIKLKRLTKLCFDILKKLGGSNNHEYKLQKKQSKGNITQTQTGE